MNIDTPACRLLIGATLLLSVFSSTAAADTEAELIAAKVSALTDAMIHANKKVLDELSSPLLSYGHSSGVIENKNEFIEKLVSGRSDFVTMDLQDQTISISGDVALVRHNLHASIKDGGVPNTIDLGVLLVWQKQHDEWKLLARQAFKRPPLIAQ